MVRVLQIPRLYSITGFPRWLFPGKSGNTQPPCAEKKTFSESSQINRYIHDECKSMWMYVYMYILFHKRCVLHFVGGYPVCRHTMIKLWSWEYPGCEFEDFWNMERKYGLKRTNLQVFLHIFCQQMIWFWGPILNWKLELHPKTARIGPTQSPPGGWVAILPENLTCRLVRRWFHGSSREVRAMANIGASMILWLGMVVETPRRLAAVGGLVCSVRYIFEFFMAGFQNHGRWMEDHVPF